MSITYEVNEAKKRFRHFRPATLEELRKTNFTNMEEKKKRQPQVEDIMINTTFVMADAIDILLRNAEKRMFKNNATLSQKYKMMHNNLLRCLRDTRIALERYNKMCDDTLSWQDRDDQRSDSNYACRIMMLIADRTAMGNSEAENKIEEFIQSLPENGKVSKEVIDEFRLK